MTQTDRAVDLLRAGELIGLPTETVYGLAADASNPVAVRKIFSLKGRPADHPVIVHLASSIQLDEWVEITSDNVGLLAAAFWPGPLTMVLPKLPEVDNAITGGQQTVAIRVPSHPVAQQILQAFGGGVAAPSANRFGRISPTCAQHVRDEFGDLLSLVVDGGDCEVGLESTILSLVNGPELLRPGAISIDQIEALLGEQVSVSNRLSQRAPGLLERHYAPVTTTWLMADAGIAARLAALGQDQQRTGLVTCGESKFDCQIIEQLPANPTDYGQAVYAALRRLDRALLDLIIIQRPPQEPAWAAVNDRLARAAQWKV